SGAIDDHRAGAAHAVLAAEVRARELEIVTQEVGQRLANLDHPLVRAAVDDDADLPLFHLGLARETARASARRVSTAAACLGYSREACRPPSGRSGAAARRPTSANASSSGVTPTRPRAASLATTGVGPTPVSAIAHPVHTPASSSVTLAATPTSAKSP